nr:odorant binding protein 18 [Trissolcus basalis]
MERYFSFLLLILAIRENPTMIYTFGQLINEEKNFELKVEEYINECKREIYRVGSSESLENFDEYVTKCIMACMYAKLGLIFNGELDIENMRSYLASMMQYLSNIHKIVYGPDDIELGLSCVEEVEEAEDVCELVSSFEQCWFEKLITNSPNSRVIESITNEK